MMLIKSKRAFDKSSLICCVTLPIVDGLKICVLDELRNLL
jgi:hypothetical protein